MDRLSGIIERVPHSMYAKLSLSLSGYYLNNFKLFASYIFIICSSLQVSICHRYYEVELCTSVVCVFVCMCANLADI